MPKGYQISQYDRPLCFDGALDIPRPLPLDQQRGGSIAVDHDAAPRRIGIIRAHLEEDAGKLLHDAHRWRLDRPFHPRPQPRRNRPARSGDAARL